MFRNLLVPIDDSKMAFMAGEVAIDIAREVGGNVTFVYVINDKYVQKILDFNPQDRGMQDIVDQFRKTGEKCINYLKRKARQKQIRVNGVILQGEPADELIEYAAKGTFDLIVMPVKDHDHTTPYLLGHVTEHVIQSGVLPVLTIPMKFKDITI